MFARACVLAIIAVARNDTLRRVDAHSADPGVAVYPGMEIRQDTNLCTLGFVDLQTRTAFTRRSLPRAADRSPTRDGNVIGHQTVFRDNTPNGATVATDHLISDWEAIALAPDVQLNDVLPGGTATGLSIPRSSRSRANRSATSAW